MLSLCLLVVALGADSKQKVNPVEKVVSLLEKIQAEIEEEGKAEAKGYDEYACFCKEQADNKQYAIEKFTEQIEVLTAKIESKTATVDTLNAEIQDLNKEIQDVKDEQTEADGIREEENAAYVKSSELLTTAIERMKGAIEALTASKGGMTDAKVNLVAKYQKTISDAIMMADALKIGHNTQKLAALIQQAPAAYSYHSNEVIATLESLLKNFKQKNIEADNDEMATRQEYEMKSGARRNQLKALEKSLSEKSAQVASLTEEINEHETEKQESQNSKDADQNFLDDLAKKCEDKAKTFDQRSSTRTQELTAIAKALELLKGDVSKMYPANDLGLVQKKNAAGKSSGKEDSDDDAEDDFERQVVSFLQVALERPETAAARKKVIGFLSRQATKIDSVVLSTLLVKLKEAPSPFAKVKQMIQDLISRLEDEAAAEASQKEWCDEEMKTATENRDKAQREIETLTALKMEKSALRDSLAEDITTLSQEVADLTKGLAEETTLREEDQATNNKTLADAEAGLEAVKGAIEVLEGFYGSFIQLKSKENPAPTAEGYERYKAEGAGSDGKTVDDMAPEGSGAMPDEDYGGKTDASKSIIGLLEVIESDFENTISTTTKDEEDAESAYQDFKSKSETSIDDKNTLKDTKDGEKTDAELAITQAEADLKTENENLQNALDELLKLKPVCVDSGMSWEERTARREQEIESLKEALKILEETDFGFLQAKRH